MKQNSFERRHIGVNQQDVEHMLKAIGVGSVNELIKETIPDSILKNEDLKINKAVNEQDYLLALNKIAEKFELSYGHTIAICKGMTKKMDKFLKKVA